MPVGGWAIIGVWPNGNSIFTGNFHDSGAISYDDSIVCGLTGSNGVAFTFTHSGTVAGTFESGARDDNWTSTATSTAVAGSFTNLAAGYKYNCQSTASFDIGALWTAVEADIGIAKEVIAVIGPYL